MFPRFVKSLRRGLAWVESCPGSLRGTDANGHGASATPENISRCRHDRFPHPGPLPGGEGDLERALRDFHGNAVKASCGYMGTRAEVERSPV